MTGSIEAASVEQAQASLAELGLEVTELEQAKSLPVPKEVGRNEFLLFNEQLASLTKAGIPLERGLRELADDAGSSRMKTLITGIADDLENGLPIEQAVEKRQKHFPPLYGMILKAGLDTGRLSEMLSSLNRHLQIEYRTFVFVMIVPTFAEVLSDMSDGKAGLPLLTRVVLNFAGHVWSFWMAIGILVGTVVFLWISLTASPAGRRAKEQFLMKLPLIGRVYANGLMAQFAEALSVLVNAGCTMDTAVELAGQSSGSECLKKDVALLSGQLRQGFNILESGMNCRIIPRLFLYSVQLGSQRNELKENLNSLGQMYSAKTYSLQSQLQAILLPLMIIFIGGVIALIVLGLFLPMIKMIQVLM
jgi:type II secretory pathway component PulF